MLGVAALGAIAGCGGGSKSTTREDRCVERMMARAEVKGHRSEVEAYARRTYCAPFVGKGWVYADGTLSIDAQEWLVKGGTCATSENGQPSHTVPCEEMNAGSTTIDCGMLHYVRRSEVQEYLRQVGAKQCDDGTPLAQLGA